MRNTVSQSSLKQDEGALNHLSDSFKRDEKNNVDMMIIKSLHFALDIILFFVAFIWFRYNGFKWDYDVGFRYNYYVTIGYGFFLYFFNKTYNANLYGFVRIRMLALSHMLSQFFSVCIAYASVCVAWKRVLPPWPFLVLLVLQFSLDVIWTYFGTLLFFKTFSKKRTLLIYRNSLDRKRFGAIQGKPVERLYEITDELEYDGSFHELEPRLKDYDSIFVAGVNSRCRNGILKYCKERGISGFFLPHVGDAIMQGAIHIQSFDSPVLYVNRSVMDPAYALMKRLFDIVLSSCALVLLSPIMLVTAILIKCYDKGPAFYKQTRLTKNGKKFEILKFRSMRVDAEKDGVARLSSGDNDDRITPIGSVIRKCRIDELPQLINIFKGDMSIVGPRPERPEIAEQYYKSFPGFRLRLQVKAGLTGYAQVYGKYNTDPYEKLEFDLLYINQMNMVTDLALCFATLFILFQSESTKGIEVGQTTAMIADDMPAEVVDYEDDTIDT